MPYFSSATWSAFSTQHGLDPRLSKAIPKLKIDHPTLVQEQSCPLILSGRDVLIKSPTGTGKSLAYIIPLIQRLISQGSSIKPLSFVILVPTKELASQVFGVFSSLLHFLFDQVSVDCFSGEDKYRRPSLPSVFITTPRGLVKLVSGAGAHKQAAEAKESIKYIVIDEADLVFSQGFEKDIREIVSSVLPREYQAVLVSATLSTGLEQLRGLILRDPVSVIINDEDIGEVEPKILSSKPSTKSILSQKGCVQYVFPCPARDKYLCLYGMIKLEIATGRMLIFTSTIDAAYRLKIFFDKFAIRSGVFNTQMPLECRNRVLSAFNDNMFSVLIASSSEDSGGSRDPESSASHRGIDFTNVAVVVNLDLPESVDAYIHRAGRTARGGKSGSVITFIDPTRGSEMAFLKKIQTEKSVQDIQLTVQLFETLRYRVEDVYKGISRRAIAAARQRELLTEILHNDQLKKKLSENSQEVQALRQSVRALREHSKVKWHLQQIPEYLTPQLQGVKALGEGHDVAERLNKRKSAEEREFKKSKRQRHTLRDKLLHKEELKDKDEGATELAPEELAPISGRKLWKIRHHKQIGSNNSAVGKPPRVARKLWKSAKKFAV